MDRLAAASLRLGGRAPARPGRHHPAAGAGPTISAERHRPDDRRRARREGRVRREAVRRPQTAGPARRHRPASGTHRGLRQAHGARASAVHGAAVGARTGRQLGLVHHPRDRAHQAAVLSALPSQRPVDGQDARHRPADEADPGLVQGRPRETRPGDDGVVQAGEDQPSGGLPAHGGADTVLHLVLLGAARERRNATGPLPALDQRSVLARPVLRAAPADGQRHVLAGQIQPAAPRSHAGKDHAVHALGDDGHDGLVSLGTGALLVDEHRAVHRPAMAGQPGRPGRGEQAALLTLA